MAVALSLSQSGAALGYSHSGAAAWADNNIGSCGIYHKVICFNDDCTGFVSAALHFGGGYAYVGSNTTVNTSDIHKWYAGWTAGGRGFGERYYWSTTFSVANDLPQFLLYDSPGGFPRATSPGTSLNADSGVGTGDVIAYDWTSDNRSDHMSLVVGYGSTSDGYYGDYTDSHSYTRQHAFWTLRTWNTSIQTTTIHPWYIDPSN
jgi:hypothetical protein